MQINWLSTNETEATVRTRSRSSTEENVEMVDFSTVLSCVILVVTVFHFYFVRLANVRPLELYPCWLPAPGLSRLRALSPCHDSRGRGSWHHISAALAVCVHGACPTVKGGLDRLARLTALSQWAVRNGGGNENKFQVCCPLPRLQGEPPESLFLMHILLPLLLGWQSCV